MATLLEKAEQLLRKRSQSVWNNYVGSSRVREGLALGIALLCSITSVIAIAMASRYAGSIAYVTTTNTTDRYGQLLDKSASIKRTSLDSDARLVIRTLVLDTFRVRASKQQMQDNAAEAEGLACAPAARTPIIGYWASHSPLGPDGSWKPVIAEANVNITSILKRPTNGYEYNVEFTLTYVDLASDTPSLPQLYQADIAVEQRLNPSDLNLGGFCATHFDFTEVH
jgi:hypothetical protein